MKPYTYLIKHLPTNQVYYGFRCANKKSPKDDLWNDYFTSSPKVHALIDEYGKDSFRIEIRKIFESKEQAVAWESKVLRRCKVLEDDRWINQNVAGYIIPTEESNKKISEFHKGRPKSEEHKEKIRLSNLGKNKGKIATLEHRQKNSEAHKGEKNGMYGKGCTPERAKKIGDANRGKVRSDEHKQKLSKFMKANADKNPGKNKSPETISKLKAARAKQVMKPRSEESKAKTREALKTYWGNKKKQNRGKNDN